MLIRSLPCEEHKVQQIRRKFGDWTSQGLNHDETMINGMLEQNNCGKETENGLKTKSSG